MLLNNFLRITSILLILSLLLPINAFASENTSNNENDTYDCPIVQNPYDMVFVPTKYNNPYFTITCYHDTAGFPIQNCISYVKIYGPEGELVHRFMPCSPYAPIF